MIPANSITGPYCHKLIAFVLAFHYGTLLKEAYIATNQASKLITTNTYNNIVQLNAVLGMKLNGASSVTPMEPILMTYVPIFRQDLHLWNAISNKSSYVDYRTLQTQDMNVPSPNSSWSITCHKKFCLYIKANSDSRFQVGFSRNS